MLHLLATSPVAPVHHDDHPGVLVLGDSAVADGTPPHGIPAHGASPNGAAVRPAPTPRRAADDGAAGARVDAHCDDAARADATCAGGGAALVALLVERGLAAESVAGPRALAARLADYGERSAVVLLPPTLPRGEMVRLLVALRAGAGRVDVPVVVLLGDHDGPDAAPGERVEEALALGAADVLRWPAAPRELIARLEARVRHGSALRTARAAARRAEAALARSRADTERTRQLVDILHEVTGDLPADEVYPMLTRRVARALDVRVCAVLLALGDDALSVASAHDQPTLHGRTFRLAELPEARQALHDGTTVLVEDVAAHELYAGHAEHAPHAAPHAAPGCRLSRVAPGDPAPPLRSALAVPFVVEGPHRGVLLLCRTGDERPLTAEDASLAEAAVEAAVSVIQRARVIEATLADNARLEELATTDSLTRVLNRRGLVERLSTEMERALRYDGAMAVLLLDLDHFKQVNDGHGHLAGDAVLRELAHVLHALARSSDVVGRFGGEEFVVALPETDLDGALAFAERLRERLAGHAFHPWGDERVLRMTASIGVAAFPGPQNETLDELVHRADAALYRAKGQGRNRVSV